MGLKSKRPTTDFDRVQALDLDRISVTSSEFSDSCGSPWRASSDETLVTVDSSDDMRRGRAGSFHLRREIDRVRGVGRGGDANDLNSDSGYGDRRRLKFQSSDKGPLVRDSAISQKRFKTCMDFRSPKVYIIFVYITLVFLPGLRPGS